MIQSLVVVRRRRWLYSLPQWRTACLLLMGVRNSRRAGESKVFTSFKRISGSPLAKHYWLFKMDMAIYATGLLYFSVKPSTLMLSSKGWIMKGTLPSHTPPLHQSLDAPMPLPASLTARAARPFRP